MKIIELKDKIIKLEDFFKSASSELCEKTGLTRFHFLMLDEKSKYFVTKYSTCDSYISFAKKKFYHLNENFQENILYPKIVIQHSSFLSRIFLRIYWQVRMYNISAITPIYRNNEIICLILFSDPMSDDWFAKNSSYINAFKLEISHCLDAIILYNQTLEGIIKEYDCSYKRSLYYFTSTIDEQDSVLIGK